jgi:uncharacterized Rmd1/YagE family protein
VSGEDSQRNPGPLDLPDEAEVRALFVAERVVSPELEGVRKIGASPWVGLSEAGGYVVVFRYGAVVFFEVEAAERKRILAALETRGGFADPEEEIAELTIAPDRAPRSADGAIRVPALDVETLQVVAEVLARTVALEQREGEVAEALTMMEPDIEALAKRGRVARVSAMVRHVGDAARVQVRLASRVEVTEKPDALWDRPELERLYHHLADDYELVDRAAILDRKAALLSQTAGSLVELQQTRRSLRVEWYIVALIVVEIVLTLYEMFIRH